MTTYFDKEIEEALRSGWTGLECACAGCKDKAPDGTCPCGQRCRCRCTLPHRVAEMKERQDDIDRVRAKMQREEKSGADT